MMAVLSVLIILSISFVVTRIATVALVHTGLSLESAKFQARSAFTGVGFSTAESEAVVTHPVRRRIMMILMLFGNGGIIAVIASLIITFINPADALSIERRLLLLLFGMIILVMIASSKFIERWMGMCITWALKQWTDLEVRDYAGLLHLAGHHKILEMTVEKDHWLANKNLAEAGLSTEGIMVIGVLRTDGSYVGAPYGGTKIEINDQLVLYGREDALKVLDTRMAGEGGDHAHLHAIDEQRRVMLEQDVAEKTRIQMKVTPDADL